MLTHLSRFRCYGHLENILSFGQNLDNRRKSIHFFLGQRECYHQILSWLVKNSFYAD